MAELKHGSVTIDVPGLACISEKAGNLSEIFAVIGDAHAVQGPFRLCRRLSFQLPYTRRRTRWIEDDARMVLRHDGIDDSWRTRERILKGLRI